LFGISNICKQKSHFLYEDSIHLYNKIRIGFFDTNHLKSIDMDKPIASFITLPEKDSLFEYQSPQGPFSDLVKCSPLAYINRLFVLYVY
jgi:hypothetical protein